MKFLCTSTINAPLQRVVDLFTQIELYPKWFIGFCSYEQLSGNFGEEGAKAKIIFKAGKNELEITETILVNNLPHEKTMLSEHKHMINTMKNTFEAIDKNTTRYTTEIEYTQFIGFMPKLLSVLMPSIFKKGTQKMVKQFKSFVEEKV